MILRSRFHKQYAVWAGAIGSILLVFSPAITLAQIAGDGTLGTQVNGSLRAPCTGVCAINGGTERGVNLYHSFKEFSIPTGGQAWFNNSLQIHNILTRVTGSSLSNLDGLIKTNGTANLFLLNPNGIVFGPNARLDIAGSFVASTASSLKLPDGSEFSATNPQSPPLLTLNLTLGLQYGPSQPGATITNRGNLTTGQDLIFAADTLDLQGQLQAGRDLTLQAVGTLQIRDTATSPFVATSGRDLTVQGNRSVDILALGSPQSQISSGGNLRLVSDGTISGDAHFFSGGNLSLSTLANNPGNFVSKFDPIIYANGDVTFGDYTGVALKVEAIGSIKAGNIKITGPECITGTSGCVGGIATADPDFATLTGSQSVILRAGVAMVPLANVPQTAGGTTFTPGVANSGQPPGSITVASIDTSNRTGGNGGSITLAATGNITTTGSFPDPRLYFIAPLIAIALGSFSYSNIGAAGNGGAITLSSTSGNITTGALTSFSDSLLGAVGNGGAITLSSTSGNITTPALDSHSNSDSNSGTAGNGGAITLSSTSGNITTDGLYSGSFSLLGAAGNGGAITLSSTSGNITTDGLYSGSGSFSGTAGSGRGGAITLSSTSGTITTNDLNSQSYSGSDSSSGTVGNGGAITLSSTSGTITTGALNSDSDSSSGTVGNGGAITLSSTSGNITTAYLLSGSDSSSGTAGSGGTILLSSTSGNITTTGILDSGSYSSSGTAGNGGAITLSSTSGTITTNDLFSYSYQSFLRGNGGGNGGAITLSTTSGSITTGSLYSFSFSESSAGTAGNGGAITLSAPQGNISSRAGSSLNSFTVSANAGSRGNGGNVTLEAQNQINNLAIFTQSSSAQAGAAQIIGAGDFAINNIQINTSKTVNVQVPAINAVENAVTFDFGKQGQSGAVNIKSSGNLIFNNSGIQSSTQGTDPAGDITITSPGFITFNNSQINSNTASTGQAGSIAVSASEGITLMNSSTIAATTSNAGRAGDITLNTPTLSLSDTARLTATATATATNAGGGSITLNASNLYLAGIVGVFAETQGQAPAGTLRLNPYKNQPDLAIRLTPNARISASTTGSGNGGDLILTAPQSITVAGSGQLAVETSRTGNAGNMQFTTRQLTLKDGVEVSASTSGTGTAGAIGIHAENVSLSGGANVVTNTSSSGAAGNLTVNVQDQLTLTGRGTGLSASTTRSSTGKGGNIIIDPRLVQIEDGATIAVDSQGQGIGGNISIQAERLSLNRQGAITAETANAQGGNITLDVKDLVLLRRNSSISATAGTAQASGDGGNINMRAPFIIGVLGENSDIIANAFTGRGGNINITTNAIYGLQFQPQLTPFSDITASSQFGISGTVAINTLNLDPSRGLTTLPVNLTDPSQQISQSCTPGSKTSASSFVSTGRGGIPSNPDEPLESRAVVTQWVSLPEERQGSKDDDRRGMEELSHPSSPIPHPPDIVEAQGWIVGADGTMKLVANNTTGDPAHFATDYRACQTAQEP